jgi:Fur family peroxide stress response transcriptional regulator
MKEKLNSNALAVLEAVRASRNHPTALEIYETVKDKRPRIGLASIYRILHLLVERGHIKELGRGEESCRYDAHTSRHDHAICTVCGALFDIPEGILLPEKSLQAVATATGITLDSYEIRLYGKCSTCQEKSS